MQHVQAVVTPHRRKASMSTNLYPSFIYERKPTPAATACTSAAACVPGIQQPGVRRGRALHENKATYRRCGRSRDAMPLLHSLAHDWRAQFRRIARRDHGGDLGRSRDARRCRVCPFDDRARRHKGTRREAAMTFFVDVVALLPGGTTPLPECIGSALSPRKTNRALRHFSSSRTRRMQSAR